MPDRAAVLHRQVDVALGTPLELPPGLLATTIYREQVVVALPADHRLADGPSVRLDELLQEPVAGPADGVAPEWDHLIAQAARDIGTRWRAAPATFGNLATALGVAAEQRFPALLTSDVRHWPLDDVRLLDVEPAIHWDTAVLRLEDSTDPDVRAFVEAATARTTTPAPDAGAVTSPASKP